MGVDLTPIEVQEAANIIEDILDEDVKLIWGMTFDDTYEDEIKVTIIANRFWRGLQIPIAMLHTCPKTRKPSISEDFISRWVKSIQQQPTPEPEVEEDLDTPAFMRKKIA